MNMSQIQAFHAVMTSTSLSEAAKKLGRTQPAVSAAIKTLEDQLGLKLFKREGRKLTPVPEAQYLLTEATAILGQVTRVKRTMKSLADGQTGALTIAAMPGPAAILFPRFIAQNVAPDQGIPVSILARGSAQIAELARAQSIDFGFTDAPENMDAEALYKAQVISALTFMVLPVDHPLAAKPVISVTDLDGVQLGSLLSSHPHRLELAAILEAQGVRATFTIESQTFLQVIQFVSAGHCCAVIDPLAVAHIQTIPALSDSVVIRPLKEPLRYRYAILEPQHSPISIFAYQIKLAWQEEVMRLLKDIGADPKIEPSFHNISDKISE
ncbi:MAG: LysR substrate-binding domain-containing protein [Pseudomonadota bacterium]